MSKFDPTRDPPYFAVISRSPPPGANAGQFLDAGERMVGMAAAELGFLGIEELTDADGTAYTVCYWRHAQSLKRWREDVPNHVPPSVALDQLICHEGCLWHWLSDVFDAIARANDETVVQINFAEKAA